MKPHPRFLPRLAAGLFTLTAVGALPVALTVLTLTPTTVLAAAEEGEITFDSFYQNLSDNGDWYNTAEFGYVFQPYIAYKNEAWRPYTDGYWAQTDQGWTWVSYEDFGWACYHYGRWTQLENTGWVWVPGYEWGPGWVSWRTSDDYVGWAPLPPKITRGVAATTVERVGGSDASRPVRPEDVEEDYDTGYNAGVDAQYDIGPGNYAFVPTHSFGAPYLAEAVVPVAQNVVIIEGTTNVTNIIYRRGSRGDNHRVIYCGGPDYNFISRRVERPIPRLLLERRAVGVDHSGPRPHGDRFSAVHDNRLEVFAPLVARPGAAGFAASRPPRIKETLDRPQVIRGWRGVQQQDPRLAERLRERFRQQAQQAPPARQVAENFVTPAAFRAQPPPPIQEQQRLHQVPSPRTAEGNRFGGGNRPVEANQPLSPTATPVPAVVGPQPGIPGRPGPGNARGPQGVGPAVEPNPAAAVQPVPGPGGRNLSEAERQARRDARQREMEQRQGNRAAGRVPATPPNVVNPGTPATTPPPAPTPAIGQPARPNRTAEERDAYRAAKQAEVARAQAAERQNQQPPATPSGAPNAERAREERRGGRTREQLSPATPPGSVPAQPVPDAAREQARAARQQQEQQAQQAAQQQQNRDRVRSAQEQQLRDQRRAARPPEDQAPRAAQQPLQQQQQQQQQQQAAERARAAQEQRRAERQQAAPPQAPPQPRQAPPEVRRPPEARPQQPAAQPGANPEEERRKRLGNNQPQ